MKDIPGYERLYAATEDGQIWSHQGSWRYGEKTNGRFLKPWVVNRRLGVMLYKDKKPSKFLVHRLVALTFIPNPNNLPQINHIDGNPSNNRIENLEWCTASYNKMHAKKHFLFKHGESHHRAKLTDELAKAIRTFHKNGVKINAMAKLLRLSPMTINSVVNGNSWRHISY